MDKFDQLGIRMLLTIMILLICVWFVTVHFLGKCNALELFAHLTHTKPGRSKLEKVWQRELPTSSETPLELIEQVSTTKRRTFRPRSLMDTIFHLNKRVLPLLAFVS